MYYVYTYKAYILTSGNSNAWLRKTLNWSRLVQNCSKGSVPIGIAALWNLYTYKVNYFVNNLHTLSKYLLTTDVPRLGSVASTFLSFTFSSNLNPAIVPSLSLLFLNFLMVRRAVKWRDIPSIARLNEAFICALFPCGVLMSDWLT